MEVAGEKPKGHCVCCYVYKAHPDKIFVFVNMVLSKTDYSNAVKARYSFKPLAYGFPILQIEADNSVVKILKQKREILKNKRPGGVNENWDLLFFFFTGKMRFAN